jgi:hypothetical protein
MVPAPKLFRATWPLGVIFWTLVVALIGLSLDWDFNLEVPISQASSGFVGKVTKESKENEGGQRETTLPVASFHWVPSFHPYFVRIVDQPSGPVLRLLKSAVIIRAPPVSTSI